MNPSTRPIQWSDLMDLDGGGAIQEENSNCPSALPSLSDPSSSAPNTSIATTSSRYRTSQEQWAGVIHHPSNSDLALHDISEEEYSVDLDGEDDFSDKKEPDDSSSHLASEYDGDSKEFKPRIANKETRAVHSLKWIVLLVLACSAVGVALATYVYINNSEQDTFHSNFEASAHKVLEAVGKSLEKTLKSLDSFSVSIVSHARTTNQTWPLVNVPDFAMRAAKIISLSNPVFLSILPFVPNDKRLEWEEFSIQQNGWLNASVTLQAEFDLFHGPLEYAVDEVPSIWGDFGDIEYNVSRDFLPQWQNYPVINDGGYPAYNWDWLSMQYIDAPLTALQQHRVVISEAYLLPDPNNPVDVAETEIWTEWLSGFVQPGEAADEPASDLYFPIFDQVDHIRAPSSVENDAQYDPTDYTVVGTLEATLFWRDLIKDILPPGNDGVVVVFENPCNPTFTYQVNGPLVSYLGRGDLHDSEYDEQRITSNFFDLHSFSVGSSLYSGPPIDKEFCPFVLNVYPSDDMRDKYTSNDPIIFTIAAVLIFAFTSTIFLVYHCTVERRQTLVMHTAERSTAIVTSLFPSEVHDRLADAVGANSSKKSKPENAESRMQAFLNDGAEGEDKSEFIKVTPPIASLYQDTTVFFADISGFTNWSSSREPADVFTLLENLYGAFDYIAKRRKVFKIETIGDCYVAVTGLPQPQPNHAVIMARFARDCRDKMHEITKELEYKLGSDTGLLTLRIGLHSGPTTAGVLRGAKSRFQLFGDTVNTAARMESNGRPNKIHVSQATADLLEMAGKGLWFTKRQDLVDAKGKGTMQTFWVEPTSSGTASVGTDSLEDSAATLSYHDSS